MSYEINSWPSSSSAGRRPAILVRLFPLTVLPVLCFACLGCGNSEVSAPPSFADVSPPASQPAENNSTNEDSLDSVLNLIKAGDTDAAIEQFVANTQGNWIASTNLEEFRVSESQLADMETDEQTRLQQQFIDRVGEIKSLARAVMDRAKEAKQRGDEETARRYIDAVNRFGEELRDADVATIFQQTGNALSKALIPD